MELKEPAAFVDDALEYCHGSAAGWDTAADYVYGETAPGSASRADPGVVLRGSLALPAAFVSLYDSVRYKSFMGLFPQINRAWLTVDTRLFLWAYSAESFVGLDPALASQPLPQGTSRYDDFFTYEGFDQVIVAVDLVYPRPGVFVEGLQYLLAVATSVEVTLLGVTFSGPDNTGEIHLIPTNISVATDNVLMVKISSSPDGRIFMAGADGSLHEFVYEGEQQRWMLGLLPARPRKKARKLVYNTSSLVKYFLPAPLTSYFSREDELLDLVVDSSRNALYTLSQQGTLTVYDMSDKNTLKNVKSISIAHESRNYVSLSIPAAEREYVSIFAIPPHLSDTVHLVVVTSFGERIYFTTHTSLRGERKPKTLLVTGYRHSPLTNSSNASRPCIHMAWWNKGCLVMADLRDKESDRLISLFPDSTSGARNASSIKNSMTKPVEMVFEISASPEVHLNHQIVGQGSVSDQARTFAIGEVHELSVESSPQEKAPLDAPRFFWVLTSQRLHLYERVQPLSRLMEILSANGGSDSEIRAFFLRYGASEVCAMCIKLAISQPTLAAAAARVFYAFGGDPSALLDPQANGTGHGSGQSPMDTDGGRDAHFGHPGNLIADRERPPSGRYFDVGRPVLQTTPTSKFSGAHEGTSLYIAQVVYPIWYECISSSRDPNGYQSLAISKQFIAEVRDHLSMLVVFLEKYAPDVMLPVTGRDDYSGADGGSGRSEPSMQVSSPYAQPSSFSGNKAPGMSAEGSFQDKLYRGLFQMKKTGEARRVESASITGLKELARRCAEALSLLLLLSEHQLHRLIPDMPLQMREMLVKLRFRDLVASETGHVVSTSLLDALFSSYSEDTKAVDHIGYLLREQCPSYFDNADVSLHRGLAMLRQGVALVNDLGSSVGDAGGAVVMYDSRMGAMDNAENFSSDRAIAFSQAEESAKVLKKAVDRMYDLQAVFADFSAIGNYPVLIDLALTVGHSAEKTGNEERAEVAYNCVLEALEPLIHEANDGALLVDEEDYNGAARPDWNDPQAESRRLKDTCMQIALTSSSEMFLKMLYRFLVQSKAGEIELLQRRSQGIEDFLKETNDQHLMWRYFAKHGRHLDAACILLDLAEGEQEKSLVDRLNYLACALHNAKTAASAADPRAESFLSNISDFMDVAKVQLRVQQELKQRHSDSEENVHEALHNLDGRILDLSTLFNEYARPFELLEACLEALRCGSYRDDAQVRSLWVRLLQREADSVSHTPALIYQKLVSVGKSFYPSEIAFPTEFLIDLLEQYVFERRAAPGWENESGWVNRLMKEIGVPIGEIVDAYRNMIESPIQRVGVQGGNWSWTDEITQLHLMRATEFALSSWIDNPSGDGSGRNGVDFSRHNHLSEREKALRAISLCKSRLRGMSGVAASGLLQRFERLENSLSRS